MGFFYWIVIILVILLEIALLVFSLFLVSNMFSTIFLSKVPWVPTRPRIGRKMFELADLKPGETVVDLGCGDGILLMTAVKDFQAGHCIGYELDPAIRSWGNFRLRLAKLSDKIELRGGNFFKAELPKADVVATYLFPEVQIKLEPLLKKYYPSGTRVISRTFRFPTLTLEKTSVIDGETLYLYRIP
ncbi:MAG: methyltransferase [Candidatus Uhrbacteria bacterium]